MAEHAEVVDHQRHQPPVQTEDHTDLPQCAHKGTGDHRADVINKLVAMGQLLTGPGRDRPDNQECQRHNHHQADQRCDEVTQRAG
ncbi:hypothetical protein SRABI106_02795 [Rahnella aquatilis]|nr:hypothetical protein SRABI106_02795 [Rahnella aquatilis]